MAESTMVLVKVETAFGDYKGISMLDVPQGVGHSRGQFKNPHIIPSLSRTFVVGLNIDKRITKEYNI